MATAFFRLPGNPLSAQSAQWGAVVALLLGFAAFAQGLQARYLTTNIGFGLKSSSNLGSTVFLPSKFWCLFPSSEWCLASGQTHSLRILDCDFEKFEGSASTSEAMEWNNFSYRFEQSDEKHTCLIQNM